MIRRWLGALMLGLFAGLVAWQVTLALIPCALMRLAVARVSARGSAINAMTHAPLVTAKARAIVRPSPDLLYSSCPFDLSAAPLLIDAVPVDAPYWSLAVFDAQTNVAFVANNHRSAAPVRIAVLTGDQAAVAGYRTVRVGGATGIALIRVLIDRGAPLGGIDAARRTARCRSAR